MSIAGKVNGEHELQCSLSGIKEIRGSISGVRVIHTDAYEVALRNGFKGTVDEWFATLKGDPGNDYVLTDADKQDIAEQAAGLVDVPDVDLTGYATEEFVKNKIAEAELGGEDIDLSDYAKTEDIPTKVSQLDNDKGYLTEHQDLSAYAKAKDIPTKPEDIGAQPAGNYALKNEVPSKTSELTNDSGFITGYTETDPTVPSWAKASTKPSYTKSEVGLGNVDNVKQYSANNPPPYPVTSVNGKGGAVTLDADAVGARPNTWMPTYSDVGARPATWTPTYTDVGADKSGTASSTVSAHNTKTDAHNDIRLLITALTTRLDALANSDDDTLDQMAEVVAYIKDNRNLIEQITTGKVSVADIVNNLTTNVSNKPLSAAQGVTLKALIDAITIPTKLSQLTDDATHRTVTDTEKASWNAKSEFSGKYADLSGKPTIPTVPSKVSAFTNDAGYITGYTETDPTVPAWAKAANKPSYSKSEVGLGNVENVKQYSASNPPPYPVTSVNGKTDAVELSAQDLHAVRYDEPIVLTDDEKETACSNIGAVPITRTVNSKPLSGNITLSASDVSAVPTSRTVNGKALSSNITLNASDVGARADTWMPTASQVGARPSTWTPSASDVGAVPTTRKVNGKALSSDITLAASDVGALASASYTTKALKVTYDDGTSETVTLVVAK